MKDKVLQAMREFGAPVNAGKIAEITGIDRKEVDKAFVSTSTLKTNFSIKHLVIVGLDPTIYLSILNDTVRKISPNTPAAVTPAPAPYPRTVSGIG